MYEAFYGLSSKPFQLNPDPSFYFSSKQHQRARAYLEYGVMRCEGFIVITGEVGAGKTTIVRGLIESLDPGTVVAAHLVSTQLGAEDTLRLVGPHSASMCMVSPKVTCCWHWKRSSSPRGCKESVAC